MLGSWLKALTRDKAGEAKPGPDTEPPDWLPDAHFGAVGDAGAAAMDSDDDEDPDDELLEETPPEVVLMLGFDPALEDDGTPEGRDGKPDA